MKPGISVIICCYNSAGRLPQTLEHLLAQKTTGINWEILVVDNASTDTTTTIAEDILQKNLTADRYKVVNEPQPGLSNARRKGYLSSQYDLLLFCDDDNWMAPNYLQTASEFMHSDNEIGILGGKGEPVFEETKPAWFDTYQLNFAVGEPAVCNTNLCYTKEVYGAGFILRRSLFINLETAGFVSLLSDRKGTQLISGGDSELCQVAKYLGYKVAYSPLLTFKHLMPRGRMTWDYLKRLHYGYGRMRLYLQAYTYTEIHNTIPGQGLRLPLWLDKYLHLLKLLIKYYPQILFKLSEEGNDEVLKFNALKGEMHELLVLKNRYTDIFEHIIKLRERAATFKAGHSHKSA